MAMYYYNGVLLPGITQDLLATYPYVALYHNNGGILEDAPEYLLICSTDQIVYGVLDSTEMLFTNIGELTLYYYDSDSETFLELGVEDTLTISGDSVIWANHNIYVIDTSTGEVTSEIFISASEPVPYSDEDYIIKGSRMTSIANAIRSKAGTTDTMTVDEMPSAIRGIKTEPTLQDKTITENGTYSADSGYDGLGNVTVECASGGAELNIHYGDTEPSDTNMLWCKCDEPSKTIVNPNLVGEEYIERLDTTLPTTLYGMGVGVVGAKIYLFGGGSETNTIYAFDTTTETITTLSTTLPSGRSNVGIGVVGTDIYIFGGYSSSGISNTIYVFDTTTETITTLSTTLPLTMAGMGVGAVGTKIYLFGGKSASYTNAIHVFDTTTETITTLGATIPSYLLYMGVGAVGTKIYLFGGNSANGNTKNIYVFDTTTETITTLSTTLPLNLYQMGAEVIGTDIYIFGGYSSSGISNTIYVFDTTTETITTSDITLATTLYDMGVGAVGTKIYIFGGGNGTVFADIYRYALQIDLNYKELRIQSDLTTNVFNILSGSTEVQLGVINILLGNSDNLGETVDAYLWKKKTKYVDWYTYNCVEGSSVTSLSASVECNVDDLVIASIITRDTLTLSSGWTLISTSDINSTDTAGNGQRLSFAYKYATSTTETITVTQASSQRLYINMVALQGATGIVDNGYSYVDENATSITVEKPNGLVLFGCSAPLWSTTSPYTIWSTSNNSPVIQLGSSTQSRLGVILDQSENTEVTISCPESTVIVGSLTIQGMDMFYGERVVSEGWTQI